MEVNPHQAKFLHQLRELIVQKHRILSDRSLTKEDRSNQLKNLTIPFHSGQTSPGMPVRVEDLGLTFQFFPSSKVYGFAAYDLRPNGEDDVRKISELI